MIRFTYGEAESETGHRRESERERERERKAVATSVTDGVSQLEFVLPRKWRRQGAAAAATD